mgnify:CR=1 FL=1
MWRPMRALAMSAVVLVAVACSDQSPSALHPGGPGARRVEGLWWLLFWISLIVCVMITAGVLLVVRRRRRAAPVDNRDPTRFVLIAGAAVPFVVLAVVFGISLGDNDFISKPVGGTHPGDALTIEVIGHQWWWEVRYPHGSPAVLANEIHIPVDTDVQLKLTTADVLHSFWVPQLMPKTDLIAGRTNMMWMRADRPGNYRGQCAEYCGMQHGHMAFMVIAQPKSEFDSWLQWASRPAPTPADPALLHGLSIFGQAGCASCHSIRGTDAAGTVGPDLTTIGDRWSLGAGTVPNDDEHLRAWVSNPQQFKPGIAMPPQAISPAELPDLIAYLRSLRPTPQEAR